MGEKRKAKDRLEGHVEYTTEQVAPDGPPITRDRRFAELYAQPPDFKELARRDADFARVWSHHTVDAFSDPECVMQLTKTLLKLDFGLHIHLPGDRLCPPVANRHNYILWLKELVDSTAGVPDEKVIGLDIGTGASCIYPLLGCAQRPWSFIATDIDSKSLEYATKNVDVNGLRDRINIVERKPNDSLIPLDDLAIDSITFTMTNPPFYKSQLDMIESAAKKSRPPFTACTGSELEMVTSGGEAEFVNRILVESLIFKNRVQWYTAMFGFLSSLVNFVAKLHDNKIDNFAVTEFVQGNKTKRWAVAWSFSATRPTQKVARGIHAGVPKSVLPDMTEAEIIRIPTPERLDAFAEAFSSAVAKLELMSWEWNPGPLEGTGRAVDKVWARAWRRKKKREMAGESVNLGEGKCVFGFKVFLRVGMEELTVGCRWVEGHDAVAFESFQGFLKTTARSLLDNTKGVTL